MVMLIKLGKKTVLISVFHLKKWKRIKTLCYNYLHHLKSDVRKLKNDKKNYIMIRTAISMI